MIRVAVLRAQEDGKLLNWQAHIAKQAHVINASAKAGIQGLVYKLAGYDATRDEVVSAFKMFVRDEAREYERVSGAIISSMELYELPEPDKSPLMQFKHSTTGDISFSRRAMAGIPVSEGPEGLWLTAAAKHPVLSGYCAQGARQHLQESDCFRVAC